MTNFLLKSTSLMALCLVAGCSEPPLERPDAISPDLFSDIPVTDELGSFDSAVAGLALWAHPTLAYRGGVIAANGEAGLIMIDFERGSPDVVDGTFSSGVAITYPRRAAMAGTSIIATYDAAGRYRFFDIDPESNRFQEWTIEGGDALPADPATMCLLPGSRDDDPQLALIGSDGTVSVAAISMSADDTLLLFDAARLDLPAVSDCAAHDAGGAFYFLTEDSRILSHDGSEQGDAVPFAILPDLPFAGIAITIQEGQAQLLAGTNNSVAGKEETDPTDPDSDGGEMPTSSETASREEAETDPLADAAVIYGYDLATGERLGAFTIAPLTDIGGVSVLTDFAADGGNFGAIYRKGVVATLGMGEARTLKLAPYSTALRNWDLYNADVLDRRDIGEVDDDEVTQPQIEINLQPFGDGPRDEPGAPAPDDRR